MRKYKINVTKEVFTQLVENHIVGYKAKRNREIMFDHFIDGMTYEEIAEKFELSSKQVYEIVRKCMGILDCYVHGETS